MSASPEQPTQVESAALRFRLAWEDGAGPRLEDALAADPLTDRSELLRQLLLIELTLRRQRNEAVKLEDYLTRFPEDRATIEGVFQSQETVAHPPTDSVAATMSYQKDGEAQPSPFPAIPGFEFIETLGQGGMGVVFKARDPLLRREVAIKMPLERFSSDRTSRERFMQEARSAANLRHPNICTIHQVALHEGRPYIVMAYIKGDSLRAWIDSSKLTPRDCADLMARLAKAVEYAHQHGVIHRDIKPANTMMDAETGQPILMDFGLAKGREQDSELSQEGQLLGTPAYMSPEQAEGKHDLVDARSDVYSLGAMLYHLLCKQPPFQGSLVEVIERVKNADPVSPRKLVPGLHRDLETICLKAMAKAPAARYQTAQALAEDLERFSAGDAILARREGILSRLKRRIRRNRVTTAALVLVLVAVIGVAFAVTLAWKSSTEVDLDALDRAMHRARLEQTDHEFIQAEIERLRPLAPERVADMEAGYLKRIQTPEVVFELEQPFLRDINLDAEGKPKRTRRETQLLIDSPSRGVVRLEAEFAPGWENGKEIGLMLNADPAAVGVALGYQFVLRAPKLPGTRGTFAEARLAGEPLVMQIVKNGVRMRERTVRPSELPAGPLTLLAQRDGERLLLQLGSTPDKLLPPLEFVDLFPPARIGVFGLLVAPDLVPQRVTGWRTYLAKKPSLLESGDDLYQDGKLTEARDFYRQQAVVARNVEDAQQARVKEALTLAALQQLDDAGAILEKLQGEPGGHWPNVAALHLWAIRLRQKRMDEAEFLFGNLVSRYKAASFVQLARLLPLEASQQIVESYRQGWGGLSHWLHDPLRVQRLERLIEVQQLLNIDEIYLGWSKLALLRALRVEGRVAVAFTRAQNMVGQEPIDSVPYGVLLTSELSWLSREIGRPDLSLIDERLYESKGVIRVCNLSLLLERARVLMALRQSAEAEKMLEEFVRRADTLDEVHRDRSDGFLMLGYLYQDRGNQTGAQTAFRNAFTPPRKDRFTVLGGGIGLVQQMIAGSLSGQLTDQEAQGLIDQLLGGLDSRGLGNLVKQALRVPPSVLRDCWQTPRGRTLARRFVFQQLPFDEQHRLPGVLIGLEAIKQQLFAGKMTAEQEEVIWSTLSDSLRATTTGAITQTQISALGGAWVGAPTFLGWGAVKDSLQPDLRGRLAYLMGRRCLSRDKKPEARDYFTQAMKDAAPDSTLRRLAMEELQRLPR